MKARSVFAANRTAKVALLLRAHCTSSGGQDVVMQQLGVAQQERRQLFCRMKYYPSAAAVYAPQFNPAVRAEQGRRWRSAVGHSANGQ
eukprot:6181217-Pleurochrysis_carterae.AAC.1